MAATNSGPKDAKKSLIHHTVIISTIMSQVLCECGSAFSIIEIIYKVDSVLIDSNKILHREKRVDETVCKKI